MPTINQLIRKGRKIKRRKDKSPALRFTFNTIKNKWAGLRSFVYDKNPVYGDYEMLVRPTVGGGGSGIIIPPEIDTGMHSIDDYIIDPSGKKAESMTDRSYLSRFLSGEQSDSLDMMTETIKRNLDNSFVNVIEDDSQIIYLKE